MNRRLAGFLILWVLVAAPTAAQTRFGVKVTPVVGVIDPAGALPDARILASSIHVVSYDEIGGMWAFGAALSVDDAGSPLGLRVGLTRSLAREETGQWGCLPVVDGGPGGCPAILILIPTDVMVTVTSASVVGRAGVGPVEVRGDVGGGWVRHAYAWDPSAVGAFSLDTGKARRDAATVQLGASVSLPVAGGSVIARYEEIWALKGPGDGRPDRWRVLTAGVEVGLLR